MEQTPKYGLKKPGGSDYVDVAALNENMDKIDTALNGLNVGKEGLLKNAAGKTTPLGADSLVLIDSAESNKTKRVTMTALAAAIDMLNGVYDVVIRTQAEFERLIASPTWLDAVSVCFVGDGGTLKFIRNDGHGCKIPQTVKQIHGVSKATIDVQNMAYSDDNYALWYAEQPTTNDYSIKGLTVNFSNVSVTGGIGFLNCIQLEGCSCNGTIEAVGASSCFENCAQLLNCSGSGVVRVFEKCTQLTNCTGNGKNNSFSNCTHLTNCVGMGADDYCYGFYCCDQLMGCTGTGASPGGGGGNGFYECNSLVNCIGFGSGANHAYGIGFDKCTILLNCIGTGTSTGDSYGIGFDVCTHLINCAGTGLGVVAGYGFANCSYLTGYKQGASASTTALLGGKNTFITLTEENLVVRDKLAVASSAWVADSTLGAQDFMFRAAIPCVGVTKDHHPNVSFSCADAMSGNFAPVADSYDGGIYIYCKKKPTAPMAIPSIVCSKGV